MPEGRMRLGIKKNEFFLYFTRLSLPLYHSTLNWKLSYLCKHHLLYGGRTTGISYWSEIRREGKEPRRIGDYLVVFSTEFDFFDFIIDKILHHR